MRIVHGIHSLGGTNGVQTYLITICQRLKRNGHDVSIYAAESGEGADRALAAGIPVVVGSHNLPEDFDVYFAHDVTAAYEMADFRPSVPQIFVWHGNLFDGNVTPQIPDFTRRVLSLFSRSGDRMRGMAFKPPVLDLTQPIDTTAFNIQKPIGERARKVVAVSNYLYGEPLEIARQGCELAGLEFRLIGAHGEGPSDRPQDAMNDGDIIFGKGRVIVEAMSCGRAAYVFDVFGGDGWVTKDSYESLLAGNFAGGLRSGHPTAEQLAKDLGRYDQNMGDINRQIAIERHAVNKHISAIVELCEEVVAEAGRNPIVVDQAFELHRLARTSWYHESEVFQLTRRLNEQAIQLGDVQWALEQSRAEQAKNDKQLAIMYGSLSWRITAPLRAFRALFGGRQS
jgi:hypothetical protein